MNPTDHRDSHIRYRLHDLLDILASYLVHSVHQFGHRLLRLLNFAEIRLQSLPDINKLVLIRIGALWNYDWRVFIVDGVPLVALEPFVGGDGLFTGIIVDALPVTQE